jgi:hypothetical protein
MTLYITRRGKYTPFAYSKFIDSADIWKLMHRGHCLENRQTRSLTASVHRRRVSDVLNAKFSCLYTHLGGPPGQECECRQVRQ